MLKLMGRRYFKTSERDLFCSERGEGGGNGGTDAGTRERRKEGGIREREKDRKKEGGSREREREREGRRKRENEQPDKRDRHFIH